MQTGQVTSQPDKTVWQKSMTGTQMDWQAGCHSRASTCMGITHARAGGSAGIRSPLCTTRMVVPTMDWKAFLNTRLPTLRQQHRHINVAWPSQGSS